MSIVETDLELYGSTTMPDDDTTTEIGGAIDTTCRVSFAEIVAADQIEAVSSHAADTTQTLTIYGTTAAGVVTSEAQTLNGTTVVTFATTFVRVLKAVLSGTTTGTITVRDQDSDTEIMSLEPGLLKIRRPFYLAAADVAGGSARDYFEKVFFKNKHGTLTLSGASVSESSDPSAKISFAVAATLDDSGTNGVGNNRLTVGDLSGLTFDSAAKDVANSGNLTAGSAQGIWLKLSLPAGTVAADTTYTLLLSGSTA